MFRPTLLLTLLLSASLQAQVNSDSLQVKITALQKDLKDCQNQLTKLKSSTTLKINQLEEIIQEKSDTIKLQAKEFTPPPRTFKEKKKAEHDDELASYFWFALIVPIMFFSIYSLIRNIPNFKLEEALSEAGQIEEGKQTAVSSSSRVIAFFSGITAMSIALSIACISLVSSLVVQTIPDFQSMVNVMLALGIGVVPYAVNKVSGDGSKKSTKPNIE